ncbi:MAG: flagellar M-ring protein FliF, partial [Planctomycetaceae bacterium]|nr:flagellar M-ring protein FliF [Planctomycetaceae bacterium]
SSLEAANIDYQLNFGGSSILVPRAQLAQARIEVRELIDSAPATDSEFEGGLWSDPSLNQVRLIRQQELRLSATIAQMKSVRSATVHVSQPDPSPFIRNSSPTKASVTLDLKPGVPFSGSDAAAIVSLVAHSVEKLTPENVTVLSTEGRILSSVTGVDGEVSGQLEYRSMLEANLASKAENLLIPLLGVGKATVRVTADVDFTETERTQRTIDPDSKAKVREEIRTESFTGPDKVALGPPGTSSNLSTESPATSPVGTRESEDLTAEYLNGETTDLIREHPGRIRRLTVAAVVELPESIPTSSTNAASVTSDQIEKIIRNAVGFDEDRGDQIEVVAAALSGVPELFVPLTFWDQLRNAAPLIRAASLGLASLVALLLGVFLIRRMKPVVIEAPGTNTLSPDVVDRLNELSHQMREHPDVVNTVLASWLEQPHAESVNEKRAA